MLDALFADPSPVDLEQLSWLDEIKARWREMQRIGRLARPKCACNTAIRVMLDGLPAGSYRFERYVLDSQRANTYHDRDLLEQRLSAAQAAGNEALLQGVLSINQEHDAESGELDDAEVLLEEPREPVVIDMEPSSVHVVRLTALDEDAFQRGCTPAEGCLRRDPDDGIT